MIMEAKCYRFVTILKFFLLFLDIKQKTNSENARLQTRHGILFHYQLY